ncbi:MAG: winged helix-turn-helix domain-containing protein [Solibacillus sp.]
MVYLAEYRTHQSVEDMNTSVSGHITNAKLTGNVRKVLECLAKHSLQYIGACHIKADTIANEIGISRSTVTRCIKKLKDSHVIAVHNNTKGNGIKGANIYAIIFLTHSEPSNEPSEMTQRATHETPRSSKVDTHKIESESLSFNLSLNPFVVKNVVNNVTACATHSDLKQSLRDAYNPLTVEDNRAFEELSKIAFGRLKQFMRTHQVPYLQMEQIIIKCMHSLVAKEGVRNQFAMYSKMIERQVLQLFEQPIQPQVVQVSSSMNRNSREAIPEWFDKRNEPVMPPTDNNVAVDFEAERQRILAKLG